MEDIESKKKQLKEVEEEIERVRREQKILQKQYSREFRNMRLNILATLGGELLKYRNVKITPDDSKDEILEREKKVFSFLTQSIPKCPRCSEPLMRFKNSKDNKFYWLCATEDGCKTLFEDKEGVPDFSREVARDS